MNPEYIRDGMDELYPKVYLYRRIVRAKLYIDAHFYQSLNVDQISSEASFSKFHFIRLFKKIYLKTPHQYLRDVRLDSAQKLMSNGDMDIESVCLKVGFESVGSFTSLFKRRFGVTPAIYRQSQSEIRKSTQEKPLHYIPGCFAKANGW